VKINSKKTNVHRKPKKGAFLVYSLRRAAEFYQHPIQIMYEGLHLINWKNTQNHLEELVRFREDLRAKIREVRMGKKRRRRLTAKQRPMTETPNGACYRAFQKWARKHGVRYSREFFRNVWVPCWKAGTEPIWQDDDEQPQPTKRAQDDAAQADQPRSFAPIQPVT
jgi:hypothetical protein